MLSAVALCFLATSAPGRPHALRLELGLGAPTGALGLSVSRDLVPWLRVEGGVGLGFSGLQLSSLARIVAGEQHRFIPGLGVSLALGSVFTQHHHGPSIAMPWLNVDALGYEYVSREGFIFNVAVGATGVLRDAHWDAAELGDDVHALRDWYPQAHLAFGFAF